MNPFMQWLRPHSGARGQTPVPPYDGQKGVHYPLIAFHGPGEANWSFAGEGALARHGFARNPVVYRCVRMIAEAAASLPVLLYEGEDEVTAHPLLDLLARPAGHMARQQFLEMLYGHLLVSGDAYVHALALEDAPRELHLLRPDRVQAITDNAGWPAAYEYTTGSTKTRIPAEGNPPPLLHVALFNPLDEITGLPPLGPAHMALDIHNAASRWNKALLDNSARPSGALVYAAAEGANLSEEQFERLKGELEEGYSGATRAGRPMLLEGGLDWKAMGYSPRDMDFIQAKNSAARDIALAYGVPPMLLGIPGDNTYANFQEANRALWRQTVLPLAGRVTAAIGGWLGAFFAAADAQTELRLEIDRDNIEALAGDREALWRRLNEATFLTADEKRAAAGYPPLRAVGVDQGEGDPLSLKFDLTGYAYDPGQPRVPAGNPDGGQWTDGLGGGSSGGSGDDYVRVAQAGDDWIKFAKAVGDRSFKIELEAEESRGGHAIERHVGRSDQSLIDEMNSEHTVTETPFHIEYKYAEALGSFSSVENANYHVRQAIIKNSVYVQKFLVGRNKRLIFTALFEHPTGREAFRPAGDKSPYMRATFGVRIVMIRDPKSPNGFHIRSAFPTNPGGNDSR